MLKILLKKQLMEVFRSYFYNPKKNTARSKAGIIGMFVLYIFLMLGVIGVSLGFLAWTMCGAFVAADMGWLYFLIFGFMAVLLGVFGSVFSTFTGLYLSKDNDLLLSMPIPVGSIIVSRLLNVYLIGLMYIVVVLLPAFIVYWIFGSCSLAVVIGCLVMLLLVSVFVLLLSCLLGWVVAKLSLRLKNKSFVSVLIALGGIGLYYFLYFKAQVLLRQLIENVVVYGEQVKGSAYGLYLFGRIGEGDWLAMLLFTAVIAVLSVLVWLLLKKSFLSIATASGAQKKTVYREKAAKLQSPDRALLGKELRRFASSANYMLNCGLGLLFLLALGVGLLIYGAQIVPAIQGYLRPGSTAVLLCAAFCLMNSMNDMAAPSVSLDARTLWQVQSLPVSGWQALRAKLNMHLLLISVPALFAVVSAAIALQDGIAVRLLFVLVCLLTALLQAEWDLFVGLKLPNLHWTNEITVIKQSGAVALAMFGGWGWALVLGGPWFLLRLDAAVYLGIAAALTAALDLLLWQWLKKRGGIVYSNL